MNRNRRLVFAALISAGVLWGTTVPLSKVALVWLPPAWLAFTRFGLAAVILMLVSRSRLRGAASPAILISGALGYGGSVLLQNFGIERTSVTHAALLIGATPVLVAILAAVCGHGIARPAAWAGFSLSLVGVAFIAAGKGGGASMGGDGLVLLSQLASASFTVSQARLLRGRDPVAVTALQLLAAAVVTLPLALLSGLHTGPAVPASVLATSALVVVGTVAPTALFAFAQSRVSADIAGAFLNLEPLVGAAAGTVLFANPLGPVQLAGGAAIVAGIVLSSAQAMRSARPRPVRAATPQLAVAGAPAAVALASARAEVALAGIRADLSLAGAGAWAWAEAPSAGVGAEAARNAAGRSAVAASAAVARDLPPRAAPLPPTAWRPSTAWSGRMVPRCRARRCRSLRSRATTPHTGVGRAAARGPARGLVRLRAATRRGRIRSGRLPASGKADRPAPGLIGQLSGG